MLTSDEILTLTARDLAAAIARGETNATAAVTAYSERIEQVNGTLNAVVVKRYAAARAEAKQADEAAARGISLGVLHGVPITIKECLDLTGTPSTFGLQSRVNHRPEQDDVYVARLREAGAIVLGKTNVAQLLLYYESDNPVYGRTNNPYNLARTPGGSTGGEAAILAAGGSALGLGTDIGGSVRVPAAFCGITSIKPTAGRTPDAGKFSIHPGQRAIPSQVGPMGRCVADVALGLRVINHSPVPLGDMADVDVTALKIAYYTDDGTVTPSAAAQRAVHEAADILGARGAQVTAWQPPTVAEAVTLYYGAMTADRGAWLSRILKGNAVDSRISTMKQGLALPHWVSAGLARVLRLAGQPTSADFLRPFGYGDTLHYWQVVEQIAEYQQRFQAALHAGGFDAILCPPSAFAAFTHGASANLATAGGYATLYNLLGYPAGVVPVTQVQADEEISRTASRDWFEQTALKVEQGSAGLPIGVQVVARPWQDHVALAVMQAIEAVATLRPDYPRLTASYPAAL